MPSFTSAISQRAPSRARFSVAQAALFITLSLVLRVILLMKFGPNGNSAGAIARVFGVGLLLDSLVAALIFLPVTVWVALSRERWIRSRWHRWTLTAGTWLWWVLLLFLFQAEFFFFEEYTSRFNTVAIDYLHYWTEVSGNVGAMYPVKRIVTLCLLGATAITASLRRWVWPSAFTEVKARFLHLGKWILATGAVFAGATQVNFQGSSERLLNEIASNGLTGGTVAMWTRDLDYAHFFPTLSHEEAFARARKLLDTPGAVWSNDPYSLQRRIPGDTSRKKLNVIVLAQESFGSEFWGCLNLENGKPPHKSLTPQLDVIAEKEGVLFTHLFADGNRTVRGMEAIFASFPPLPGDAILARNKSQNCETLASVLDRDGYSTTFIYPGRGLFDDMEPFMLANGFQHFISGPDFPHPSFSTVWGHCDEDLYDRALEEARSAHASGRPFFLATMSVSNHQPFIFPKGKVDPKLKGHKGGARYSDLAVSRFIEQAKKEPFWQDTIIAIVADHGARVYGSQTVPVLSYEIPLLIVGPAVVNHPQRINTAGCQLDVAPTILGLIGRPYDSVFYGRDLLTPSAQRFALLNHNRSIAIYREPELVALSLGKVVERFTRADRRTLIKQGLDASTEDGAKDATALFQTADELYRDRRYTVRPSTN